MDEGGVQKEVLQLLVSCVREGGERRRGKRLGRGGG